MTIIETIFKNSYWYQIKNRYWYQIKNSYWFQIKNNLKRKEPVQHLGRWNLANSDQWELKSDYANLDSCGDRLCGKPDYFKEKEK